MQGSSEAMKLAWKVLVPLWHINSFHHASVSPGVCWLKCCCRRPWMAQGVAAWSTSDAYEG